MGSPSFVTNEAVSIRDLGHDERWLEEQIKKDPGILGIDRIMGLGQLKVKDQQIIQPRAGRMDLLLADQEEDYFFETELMLGKLDESHITLGIHRYPRLLRRRSCLLGCSDVLHD